MLTPSDESYLKLSATIASDHDPRGVKQFSPEDLRLILRLTCSRGETVPWKSRNISLSIANGCRSGLLRVWLSLFILFSEQNIRVKLMKDGYVSLDSTFESTNPDYRNQYSTTAGFPPNYILCMICKLNSSTKKNDTPEEAYHEWRKRFQNKDRRTVTRNSN